LHKFENLGINLRTAGQVGVLQVQLHNTDQKSLLGCACHGLTLLSALLSQQRCGLPHESPQGREVRQQKRMATVAKPDHGQETIAWGCLIQVHGELAVRLP
jgi:hypothetical protein